MVYTCLASIENYNQIFEDGETPLTTAINQEQHQILSVLLSAKSVDINFKNRYGRAPLHCAVKSSCFEMQIKLLHDYGADLNITSDIFATPLILAIKLGYVDVVKSLLQYGADVTFTDEDGKSPFIYAYRSDDVMEILFQHAIKNKLRIHLKNAYSKYARQNQLKLLRLLVNVDISGLNETDSDGNTPLHISVINANTDIVSLLLSNGADIFIKNDEKFDVQSLANRLPSSGQITMLLTSHKHDLLKQR